MSNVIPIRDDPWNDLSPADLVSGAHVIDDLRDEPGEGIPPPHDLNAEAGLLATVLVEPGVLERVAWLKPEDFYSEAHRRIFEAALFVREHLRDVDLVTVGARLRESGRIAQVGGMGALIELLNAAPARASTVTYARIVQRKARVRRMIDAARRVVAEAYVDHGDDDEFVRASARKLGAFEREASGQQVKTNLECLKEIGRKLDEHARLVSTGERAQDVVGLPTGLRPYDRVTSGLHAGHLTVVAARPGRGKTALGLQWASNVARLRVGAEERRVGVGFVELEMTQTELLERATAQVGRVNMKLATVGRESPAAMTRAASAMAEINSWPLVIEDKPGQSVDDVRATVFRWLDDERLHRAPLGVVVVDHLQKIAPPKGRQYEKKNEVLAAAMSALKDLAKELRIVVIVLAQLGRAVEKENREPRYSDIEWCGGVEQDADNIVFLHPVGGYGGGERHGRRRGRYAPPYVEEAQPQDDGGRTTLILAKQRGGEEARIDLVFEKEFTRFVPRDEGEQGAFDGI